MANVKIDEHGVLECPNCGSDNLHQVQVETWWRQEEDAEKGVHVVSTKKTTTVDESQSDNPSSRRDGLVIKFLCEHCDDPSFLKICQHKGSTTVQWGK